MVTVEVRNINCNLKNIYRKVIIWPLMILNRILKNNYKKDALTTYRPRGFAIGNTYNNEYNFDI